jgi:hypothetical protein
MGFSTYGYLEITRGIVKGGRDYETYPELFDYEGDAAVLDLIKRIDYIIAAPDAEAIPFAPRHLRLLD